MQAYCVKCKVKKEMQNATPVTMKNGKRAMKGICPACGTGMYRIGEPWMQRATALVLLDDVVRVVEVKPTHRFETVDGQAVLGYVYSVNSNVSVRLSEQLEEFEWLIRDEQTKEGDLQRFFEEHPSLLLGTEHERLHAQVVLRCDDGRSLRPDFLVEPLGCPDLCDIVDLKQPQQRVFIDKKNRPRLSAAVMDAVAQLREYGAYFRDKRNHEWALSEYGFSAYRPTLMVIIGREEDGIPLGKQKEIQRDLAEVQVRTYDDVARRIKTMIRRLDGG